MGCRDHYITIKELEEQHIKYIQMMASVMPVHERPSSASNSLPSCTNNLRDYAICYISNSFKNWGIHVHSDTYLSICSQGGNTEGSSKRLKIKKSNDGINFKFALWNKDLPSSLYPPTLAHMSSLQTFHAKVYNMLDKLDGYNFCKGVHVKEAVCIVEKEQQSDLYVDYSSFCNDKELIKKTV